MDQQVLAQVHAALDASEDKLAQFEHILAEAQAMAEKVGQVALKLEKNAAMIANLDVSARADLYVEASLSDLMAKIDQVEDKLGPAAFTLDWNAASVDAAEEGAASAAARVVNAAQQTIGQLTDLTEAATTQITDAMQDIATGFESLVDEATEASVRTEQAQDKLLDLMETKIPDLGDLVNDLVGNAFSARLKEMTEDIDAVLDKVEKFVDSATSEVTGRLAGVSDLLQAVNDIVQPLEPAFDAFEILT